MRNRQKNDEPNNKLFNLFLISPIFEGETASIHNTICINLRTIRMKGRTNKVVK